MRRRRWIVFLGLAALIVTADQLSKLWIDANFALASPYAVPGTAQPTPVIGDLVRIAKSSHSSSCTTLERARAATGCSVSPSGSSWGEQWAT
jgi:hypothetical protein